jgi:predicted DNA-binding protein with PD1-like motif
MNEREVTSRGEYLLRLERGEDVLPSIAEFCKRKGILSASFRAIGAVEQSKIGYYDLPSKKYGQKEYPDAMEVASMTGNVAQVDGQPFVHCHSVLSGIAPGTENQPVGGHVFEAKVAVTLEVHLIAFNENISRSLDEDIGLKLLAL